MFEKLDEMMNRYEELNEEMVQPEVAGNFEKYQACLKERNALQPVVRKYQEYLSVTRQLEDARELLSDPVMSAEAAAEIETLELTEKNLTDELRWMLIPPDPLDSRNVILEIRAGVGGDEAALFAGDLLRMYQKYADRNGLDASVLSLSDTDLGGVNEALMMLAGPDAFARMKFESGIHCVKRVPVTESGGRIHTSTVTVAVFPEAEEIDLERG